MSEADGMMNNGAKTMIRIRWAALLLALMLALTASALAGARMPVKRGALTDDADVLSAQVASDIAQYAEMAQDETGVNIYVGIVHFLDGLDVQIYANRLFQQWNLGDEDILLLGAAGEDSFATALGDDVRDELGKSNAENLLYTSSSFGTLFQSQRYDAAMGSWFAALNALLNKQYHTNMELGSLFASAQADQTVQAAPQGGSDYASALWENVLGSIDEHAQNYQTYRENQEQQDGNGIGVGGWVVMAIIIMIIFGQSDPVRKARNSSRKHYKDYGRGCSPLGWILAMIGAGAIIDKFRARR